MAIKHTSHKLSIISILLIAVTGCGSDTESTDLKKAVTLEELRTEGTIIESVTIINNQTRIRPGEQFQLKAMGIDSNGETRDVTDELTWSTSDPEVATVNSRGLVTAITNSPLDRGLITVTGTTINEISGEGQMSISDEAVSNIELKQASPEIGDINTCIEASISADITYSDGYISLNTIKDISFTLDDETSALIDNNGTLYTSSSEIENTSITANIGNISDTLIVTANPANLESIDILSDDTSKDIIKLNLGSRISVAAQANLINNPSPFDIDNTIKWSTLDSYTVGVTKQGENKGTLLALKPGVTELVATCGGVYKTIAVQVEGDATLESIQINDAENPLTLSPLGTLDLTLTANYSDTSSSLNVSEFANWSVNGSTIANAELINIGTNQARYRLTSNSNSNGTVIVSVNYDGIVTSTQINIE
ncbi:Ig-like domain-containing protein [Pseudoalteromonas sp. 2CM41L]|uniref:Ig-like domain-containing protein n=1 Tax=Pseudoalteromonas sp. 2CM41L TaxID=2929857 RepID=UPI0020BF9F9A|nr:Ig-like domain-containing protein [Pseudoalteromonas sp. 2CM41L]MCK8106445.1 Ig-like domain-containing protein [Pseudoalteromonas sp. 2CM41L]